MSTDTLPRGNDDVVLPMIFVGLMLGWAYGTAEIEEYPKVVVVGMGFGHANNQVGELEGWIDRAGGGKKVSSEQIEEEGGNPEEEEEGMHVGRCFKNLRVAEGEG